MESNYVEGRSDNLPAIDPFMISMFFVDNMDFLSAEIKGVKNLRAARADYGDQAIGYVQLKRETNLCTIKGKITPEHKVRSKSYDVTIRVDEANDKIISSECHDCAASQGKFTNNNSSLYESGYDVYIARGRSLSSIVRERYRQSIRVTKYGIFFLRPHRKNLGIFKRFIELYET